MSIESMAAEYGTAAATGIIGGIIGWWAERIRAKRAKKAVGAAVRLLVLMLIPAMTGCATIEDGVLYADAKLNPPPPAIPAGYEIVWDVYNPQHQVVDLAGWYRLPRLQSKQGVTASPVSGATLPDPNAPPTAPNPTKAAIEKLLEAAK
jgi:hypothetical protein